MKEEREKEAPEPRPIKSDIKSVDKSESPAEPVIKPLESSKGDIFPSEKDLKEKRKRRKKLLLKIGAGLLVVLIVLGLAAWQLKWYQSALDWYNRASVSIKVREGDTFAIEGAKVSFLGKEYITDANGKVNINGAVAGTAEAVVTKEGYLEAHQNISLKRGNNDLQTISMTKEPEKAYAVKGFVQDFASGQPIADVQVTLGSKTVLTDPSGAYTFEKVAPGDVKLTFSKAEYVNKELPVTVVDADIATAKVPLVPAGQVVFVSNRDGKRALYAANYDGSEQRIFVQPKNEGEDFSPNFSPNTSSIAFSSTRDKIKSVYGNDLAKLYLVDASGKEPKKVAEDVAQEFAPIWSPDSNFLYFSAYSSAKLDKSVYKVYDVKKGTLTDLGESAYNVVFSPISTVIAYYVNTSENRSAETVQPDGSTLTTATTVYLNELKTLDLLSGERKSLAKREQGMSEIRFSSDGKAVSYEVVVDGVRRRYQVTLADGKESEVPVLAVTKRSYVASPKGDLLAFIEERDGKKDLFIVDKDEKNEKRLTNVGVVNELEAPVWAQGSAYLTFAVRREGENALYLVSVLGGEPKKITDFYSEPTGTF